MPKRTLILLIAVSVLALAPRTSTDPAGICTKTAGGTITCVEEHRELRRSNSPCVDADGETIRAGGGFDVTLKTTVYRGNTVLSGPTIDSYCEAASP